MDRKTFIKLLGGSSLGISLMGLGVYTSETKTEFEKTTSPLFFKLALVQKSRNVAKFLDFAKQLKSSGLEALIYRTSLLNDKKDWATIKAAAAATGLKNLGLQIEGSKIKLEDCSKWGEVAEYLGCQFVQLNLEKTDSLEYLLRMAAKKKFALVVDNLHLKSMNIIRQFHSARLGLATSLSELNQKPQHINLARLVYLTPDCQNLNQVNYCKSLQILKSSGYRDYVALDCYDQVNLRRVKQNLDLMRRCSVNLI